MDGLQRIQGQQPRGLTFRNDSGETIPGFAVMRITGVIERDGLDSVVLVRKPKTGNYCYMVNGPLPVAANAYGYGTFDFPAYALFDGQTSGPVGATYAALPVNGEEWGPENNSWKLVKDNPGFRIWGNAYHVSGGASLVFVSSQGCIEGQSGSDGGSFVTGKTGLTGATGASGATGNTGASGGTDTFGTGNTQGTGNRTGETGATGLTGATGGTGTGATGATGGTQANNCCPGVQIGTTVTVTLTSTAGCAGAMQNCGTAPCNVADCIASQTINLDWNASTGKWEGTGAYGTCGPDVTLRFYCSGGASGNTGASEWRLDVVSFSDACRAQVLGISPTGTTNTCDPLNIVFRQDGDSTDCCGCCLKIGSWNVFFTITE